MSVSATTAIGRSTASVGTIQRTQVIRRIARDSFPFSTGGRGGSSNIYIIDGIAAV